MKIEPSKHWKTAMQGYADELMALVSRYPDANILELGGGRWPSFRLAEMPDNVAHYTVNDIDPNELAHNGPEYDKACFDVSGDSSEFKDTYDVVFSRFLAEHVEDGLAMHRNVFNVLKPGGAAFHLIPTLYATPFVINRIFPERLSTALLSLFTRRREISPKFPAYYSACHGDTRKMRKIFRDIGYSRVEIRNFYGHFYYENIPVARELEQLASGLAAKNEWKWWSSYAYITAYK
jgi:SAM-dependent methyltransferase